MATLTSKYVRRPFEVRGVQVTEENMPQVAEWCNGTIETTPDGVKFVKVNVKNPIDERQTLAFVGRWVLYSQNGGYKVYTDRAFRSSFEELVEAEIPTPREDTEQLQSI